jgi:hypothetical protein
MRIKFKLMRLFFKLLRNIFKLMRKGRIIIEELRAVPYMDCVIKRGKMTVVSMFPCPFLNNHSLEIKFEKKWTRQHATLEKC